MKCSYSDKKAIKIAMRRAFVSGARSTMSLRGRKCYVVLSGQWSDKEALRGRLQLLKGS